MHAERSFAFQLATAFITSFALLVARPTSGAAQTVGVFTVATAASVVGIAWYDNYKPPLSQQQTVVIQTAQQTAPVQEAPAQHAVRAPETVSEKQSKLAAMEAYDQSLLAADGYKATARLDYGKCNDGPPTRLVDPGLHYHSTSTCIEYAAVVTSSAHAGQHVHIYVQHQGCRTTSPIPNSPQWKAPPCRRTKPRRPRRRGQHPGVRTSRMYDGRVVLHFDTLVRWRCWSVHFAAKTKITCAS